MKVESTDTHPFTVLVVDDLPANLTLLTTILESAGFAVAAAANGATALQIAELAPPDAVLMDVMMPEMNGFETCRRLKQKEFARDIPVIFITAVSDTGSRIEAFKAGGVDHILKPFEAEEVLARVRAHLEIHKLTRELRQKNQRLEAEMALRKHAEEALDAAGRQLSLVSQIEAERWGIPGFVGQSGTFRKILQDVRRLQNFDSTNVLITGESGTGKELVARAIHFGSARASTPFLPVNCSAIPAELAESSFFGHVRGAFTGASADRQGFFELADGGTLFLDEIGDMPAPLQAKLLRVLEDGHVTRVGASQSKRVNVRIVSATNKDLLAQIKSGGFREDLYYRLAGFTVWSPPLRERKDDIPLLAGHLLNLLATEIGLSSPKIERDALESLMAYAFPGNIRELRNVLMRALIQCDGGSIRAEHLQLGIRSQNGNSLPAIEEAYFRRMTEGGEDFWQVIQDPYLDRALNREQVKKVVALGLEKTAGSYKNLLGLFGLPEDQYTRFMDFLRHNRLKPSSEAR